MTEKKKKAVEMFLKEKATYTTMTWKTWFAALWEDFIIYGYGIDAKRPMGESGWRVNFDKHLKKHKITAHDLLEYWSRTDDSFKDQNVV